MSLAEFRAAFPDESQQVEFKRGTSMEQLQNTADHAHRVALTQALELGDDLAVELRMLATEHNQLHLRWPSLSLPAVLPRRLKSRQT
jgi:hypothetical protein